MTLEDFWPTKEIALGFVATFKKEEVELFVRLDAFGQDRNVQAAAQNRAYHRLCLLARFDFRREASVELDAR